VVHTRGSRERLDESRGKLQDHNNRKQDHTRSILTLEHQKWRQKAETLYRTLPKEEMSSRWNKDLRASLDELREYQAVDAPSWFDAKERLDALSRDEEQRRSARGDGQRRSARGAERRILVSNDLFTIELVDGEKDEDEDEDEDEEMESEAQYDGIDDGDDEDDEDGMTMEEIEARQAAEEAKEAAVSKAAQESAEISKMMEKTQLSAEATASKNGPSASKAKHDAAKEPSVATAGHETDVGTPANLDLSCTQCDQKFPDQHSLVSHAVDAHPGAAFDTVILKLVDDRFNALVEEKNRKDARKETDRVAEALADANKLLQETTEARSELVQEAISARIKLYQERHAARANATQQEAQLEQKFNELHDQLIATFTNLVGLADEHLGTTANQDIARIVEEVTTLVEQKAQRMREIAKSEHERRTKEAVQREIDALDAEDALQTARSVARQAQKGALQARLRE
jgi:hypothetical protein